MRNTTDFDLVLDARVSQAIRALQNLDELLQLRPDAMSDWQHHDLEMAFKGIAYKKAKAAA